MFVGRFRRRLVQTVVLAGLLGTGAVSPVRGDDRTPWRLRDAVGAPEWLDFGLSHRLRVEHLQNDYRAAGGDHTALVLRSLATGRVTLDPVFLALEVIDARAYATDATPINTTVVDTLDVLQAHVGLDAGNLFVEGDAALVRLGRITIDVGSRRFVARNSFRNTINAFTGIDAQWTSPGGHVVRGLGVVPVTRLPSDAASVRDNDLDLDEENLDLVFWGAFYGSPAWFADTRIELFVFGMHEADGDLDSANRRLVTPGVRLHAKPSAAKLDFQAEAALQLGRSRATADPADTADLDHRAFVVHAELGYTIDVAWQPRAVAQYDHASGDADPADDVNGRFDPLFGARRFDFGPTGIYGPFVRSNVASPGARVEIEPHERVDAFVAYRLYWLASSRDAWTSAGLSDGTGGSGAFIGHQPELRVRWHILPDNLDLDVGAAQLFRAGFAVDAPSGRDDPSTFVYAELTGTI